jgi:hypothetical protein
MVKKLPRAEILGPARRLISRKDQSPGLFRDERGLLYDLFGVEVLSTALGMSVEKLLSLEKAGILPGPRFVGGESDECVRLYSHVQIENVREAMRLHTGESRAARQRLKRVLAQVFYLDVRASPHDLQPRHFVGAYGPKTVRITEVARDLIPAPAVNDGVDQPFKAQLLALVRAIIPLWRAAHESTQEAAKAHADAVVARIEALCAYAADLDADFAHEIEQAWLERRRTHNNPFESDAVRNRDRDVISITDQPAKDRGA